MNLFDVILGFILGFIAGYCYWSDWVNYYRKLPDRTEEIVSEYLKSIGK
ncbi:MAG: hypothetical protein AAB456_00215 [Patescibacteria group bacterium]